MGDGVELGWDAACLARAVTGVRVIAGIHLLRLHADQSSEAGGKMCSNPVVWM